MLLSEVLCKERNNIDIIRLIAACAVIFAHADAIVGEVPSDCIYDFLTFDYSGHVAVKLFFFLSGLVVTNSLLSKRNIFQFAVARICRIMPALAVVLGLWAFVLGPMLTTLSLGAYFSSSVVYTYFFEGILLKITYALPGVYADMANSSINASIWVVPYEMLAYVWLGVFFIVGVFRFRIVPVLLTLFLLYETLSGSSWVSSTDIIAAGVNKFLLCFAFGSLIAVFKDRLRITLPLVIGLCVAYWLSRGTMAAELFFYPTLFISSLYISTLKWMLLLKPTADISYGVYLWGWPAQQLMHLWFPDGGKIFNWLAATVLAMLFGYASWHLIEKHFIRWGAAIGKLPWPEMLYQKLGDKRGSKVVRGMFAILGCNSGR